MLISDCSDRHAIFVCVWEGVGAAECRMGVGWLALLWSVWLAVGRSVGRLAAATATHIKSQLKLMVS